MDRKTYMRDIYSKYWIHVREKKYGFLEYDRNLCRYISTNVQNQGGGLLEVAIGTGYPFADFFQKAGYSVYGIDIAPDLVRKCQNLNPAIICKVGDAETLDFPENQFNCTYCFHSTWYFPDLNKVIDEMLHVTKSGGLVIFDIQNRNNRDIANGYRKRLLQSKGVRKVLWYLKNIVKLILCRGPIVWEYIVHEVPTYPESIYNHLGKRGVTGYSVMVRKQDETLEIHRKLGPFEKYPRLIFAIVVP